MSDDRAEPGPDHAEKQAYIEGTQNGWDAAIEAAKSIARLVREDCFAPMTRTREEAFSAACGEVERQIDKLKRGQAND